MAKPKFALKGVPEFMANVKLFATAFPKAARRGLYLGLEFTMTESKRDYVPVRDGILRASGFVKLDEDPERVRAEIGFGGPAGSGNHGGETNRFDVGYAVVQHENLDFHHKVGEAKYLERPLYKNIPKIGEMMVQVIKKDTGIS
jgi:hypothetical protein